MMEIGHTLRAFDTDLQELVRKIGTMGRLVGRQAEDAIEALLRHDYTMAKSVMISRDSVDAMQREIEDKAITTIARRQPMAIDLRQLVGAFRIAKDLEHIGDHAEDIANDVLQMTFESEIEEAMLHLKHMMELAIDQLSRALRSYEQSDLTEALEVWHRDKEVDALNNSLFRQLLTYMMEDPRNIGFCTHLLFCAKNVERIGDHATNVAETVYYIVRGQQLLEERPKADVANSQLRTPVGQGT
jgi:phosphate transport system protein